MQSSYDTFPYRSNSLRGTASTSSASDQLLTSILATLQRLEQHVEEQNTRLSTIDFSALSDSRQSSPVFGKWNFDEHHLEQPPKLRAYIPENPDSTHPLTPPDSLAESPRTPYTKVVTHLKDRFAFVDSDEESEDEAGPSAPPTMFPEHGPNTARQIIYDSSVDGGVQVLPTLDEDDHSVYSTQLLASQLALAAALPVGRAAASEHATCPGCILHQAYLSEVQKARSMGNLRESSNSSPSIATDSEQSSHGSSLRRSLSNHKVRVVNWAKVSTTHSWEYTRVISAISMHKLQLSVELVTKKTRAKIVWFLQEPGHLWDVLAEKMIVDKVFYK